MEGIQVINVSPVILCGGSGTRLWPLSRTNFPKQFLALDGKLTLFQQAMQRLLVLKGLDLGVNSPIILANEEHRFLVQDQLLRFPDDQFEIILEPSPRNTAPAITLAALHSLNTGVDSVMVITPSDQKIFDVGAFLKAVTDGIHLANQENIVVLGVPPEHPETGYGYIQRDGKLGVFNGYEVKQFVEKPDKSVAQSYLTTGDYYWNSGIFIVKASVWLRAVKKFRPEIYDLTNLAFKDRVDDGPFVRPDSKKFEAVPSDSIDYAVMEHCPTSEFPVKLLELNVGWNDLGSWGSIFSVSNKDTKGNALVGDVLAINSKDSLVFSTDRLVATVGVENLIVVETPDAVMVINREADQDVKLVVLELERLKREEKTSHRKVNRPWGWYDTVDIGDRFKVKRIQVNPRASLSLQMHKNRAEHWVVVKGVAEVICGAKKFLLKENESTFIPRGEVHRLSNPTSDLLEIVEVQSGMILDESDIIRFGDDYGRSVQDT